MLDFGGLNVGDPACGPSVALPCGCGWALSVALIALPYAQHTGPTIAAASRRIIEAMLDDAP
ncbi:hypothetical protein [Deinococcus sonorensis]|uniref:Uncharacterized protein n=2 Tax=Deinococcus sonorensis TaxID=309891 RepID=A0AAU7UDS7_9DEIO